MKEKPMWKKALRGIEAEFRDQMLIELLTIKLYPKSGPCLNSVNV